MLKVTLNTIIQTKYRCTKNTGKNVGSLIELQSLIDFVELETLLQNRRELERENGECHVVGYNASCCQHIEVDKVKLNSTGKYIE